MSEDQNSQIDELSVLKMRARAMGLEFSNNIGLDTLRAKVNAALEEEPDATAKEPDTANIVDPADLAAAKDSRPFNPTSGMVIPSNEPLPGETQTQATHRFRQELLNEQMRLVRCRIQCLNPHKTELPGEIFTVANDFIGNVTKFIPYGEDTDDGYHLPYCLYNNLAQRRFQHIRTVKDKRTGTNKIETSWAREFAIEVLPPLTKEELKQLAMAQIAVGAVDGTTADNGGASF